MNYQVKITETAKQDLRDLAFYIVDKYQDQELAKRTVKALQAECKKLNQFPNAGAPPKDRILRSAGHRFIVYKNYLIFYQVDEKCSCVYVNAIFNAKMDYMRVMRKFI